MQPPKLGCYEVHPLNQHSPIVKRLKVLMQNMDGAV
jgi:hypothetical protein